MPNTIQDPFADGPFVFPFQDWLEAGQTLGAGVTTRITIVGSTVITSVLFTSADALEANSHTLQRLLEVNYVREGNRVLSTALEQLDDSLQATQKALDILATLQQLHNTVTVQSVGQFPFQFDGSGLVIERPTAKPFLGTTIIQNTNIAGGEGVDTNYMKTYLRMASAFYGLPIFPDFVYDKQTTITGIGDVNAYVTKLEDTKAQLSAAITQVDLVAPGTSGDSSSFLGRLKQVYADLPPSTNGQITVTDAKMWTLDFYRANEGQDYSQNALQGSGTRLDANGNPINPVNASGEIVNPVGTGYLGTSPVSGIRADSARAGTFQQNITFAITAGQSFNDTQKEKVRRYMFVFEEYYKSASSMLQKISQLIEKMAQGIRPA